jgi:hypothetical protein
MFPGHNPCKAADAARRSWVPRLAQVRPVPRVTEIRKQAWDATDWTRCAVPHGPWLFLRGLQDQGLYQRLAFLRICSLNILVFNTEPSIKIACEAAGIARNLILDLSRDRKSPNMEPSRATVIVPLYIWPCSSADWQPLFDAYVSPMAMPRLPHSYVTD